MVNSLPEFQNCRETWPILQEFAKLHGLQAPNWPPNMFDSTLIHQNKEGNNKGEDSEDGRDAQDLLGTEDEWEFSPRPWLRKGKSPDGNEASATLG
ncbi:hypothetical protein J1N35_038089 [Gossypium stocksii]|uniref:Uncharacterized protein n=1 Tax=Gossypium stocksii TaxID=47602 RepID=A0A9D3UL82_9ROSI|nr:hypothetical protein J1N35_038089 [Gossypium stocksii]